MSAALTEPVTPQAPINRSAGPGIAWGHWSLAGIVLVLLAAWTCCLFAVKYAHDEDEEPRPDCSRGEEEARVTGEFLRECLIPMVGSAMLLVVALAWYRAGGLPDELVIGPLTLPALTAGGWSETCAAAVAASPTPPTRAAASTF